MNFALLGYGYWGKIWEKVLKSQNEVSLKNIYTPRLEEDGYFTNDLDKLLSSDLDAVIVAAPNQHHFELVKVFLERGKHVLCEKPLVLTKKEAISLDEIANQNNVKLETNFTYLHSPTVKEMKKNLHLIGDVYAMESYIDGFGNFYENEDVYSVHCPHVLAVTLDFFPNLEFEVSTDNLVFSKSNTVDVGIIKMNSGDLKIRHHSSLRGIKKERKIVLFGEKGVLEYDATSEKQYQHLPYSGETYKLDKGEVISLEFDESQNIGHSLSKFVRVIKGEEEPNSELSIKVSRYIEIIMKSVDRK